MQATMSSKGQVVIPREIREAMGMAAGSTLDFAVQGNVVELRVMRNKVPSELLAGHGLLKKRREALPADFDVASLLAPASKTKSTKLKATTAKPKAAATKPKAAATKVER
jgi:AbrB family looped-hinge helix DNA binding protein